MPCRFFIHFTIAIFVRIQDWIDSSESNILDMHVTLLCIMFFENTQTLWSALNQKIEPRTKSVVCIFQNFSWLGMRVNATMADFDANEAASKKVEAALSQIQPIRDLAKNWDIDIASW